MKLDVRLPIGLMFSVFGLILVVFGMVSDHVIYDQHSLGININLAWGAVQLLFGVVMVGFALRAGRNAKP